MKSNCDKTKKKPKLWQNLRTQTVTKLKNKQIVTKLERSNFNQTQKLKSCKTQKLNRDNSCNVYPLNTLTTDQLSGQLFAILAMFFF